MAVILIIFFYKIHNRVPRITGIMFRLQWHKNDKIDFRFAVQILTFCTCVLMLKTFHSLLLTLWVLLPRTKITAISKPDMNLIEYKYFRLEFLLQHTLHVCCTLFSWFKAVFLNLGKTDFISQNSRIPQPAMPFISKHEMKSPKPIQGNEVHFKIAKA